MYRFIFVIILLFFKPALAKQQTPEQWLYKQGDALIAALSNKDDLQRYNQVLAVAEQVFHRNELSKLSLGKYWQTFSPEEQKKYRSLFFEYFVAEYAKDPIPVQSAKFKIIDKIEGKDILLKISLDGTHFVNDPALKYKTAEALNKQTTHQVNFEMIFALRARNDGYYIRDVQIEGQSMVMFVRNLIERHLKKVGYMQDQFLEQMEQKINSRKQQINKLD